ncbi:MAG: monofunctional biosynthetic peptidoglycan transglycosylase [Deltaproteobacteria bacterium]|nr:monofunctional biosynthetic peptidoglycan transglycosylase [Deltaproteobacteria bacterium]
MRKSGEKKRPRGFFTRGIRIGLGTLLSLCLLSLAGVVSLRFLNPPFTAWMACQWLEDRFFRASGEEPFNMPRIQWRSLKQVSPHLVRAVLAGEDQRFLSHNGFDFIELREAVEEMVTTRRMRGASTITMQVARTVFLWPSRTWFRKLMEVYYTVLIELLWNKQRILEVYLNTVDWGDGIAGAESAAKGYFGKSASRLTPSEAAMLAAILPNPHAWSPTNPGTYVKERQKRILRDMERMPSSRMLRSTQRSLPDSSVGGSLHKAEAMPDHTV